MPIFWETADWAERITDLNHPMGGIMSEATASGPAQRFEAKDGPRAHRLYRQMRLIRRFEQKLLERFEAGDVAGTTHACIGQEADCVGVINHLGAHDVVFSNHRCHGHFLVYSDRPELLAAEVMGRETGLVGGRGGSQHICWKNFYSNGIQGGIVPVTVGMGLAEKVQNTDAIAVVFLGDGTFGEGAVYEAMNMASLWSAPVLFVVENNRWAQSTPVHLEMAGNFCDRARAFDIDAGEIESTDAEELYDHFGPIVDSVRARKRPHLEVIHTYRLCHHSKSDDKRPREEVEAHKKDDPLPKMRQRLNEDDARRIDDEVDQRVDGAFQWAIEQPFAHPSTIADPLREAAPPAGPARIRGK